MGYFVKGGIVERGLLSLLNRARSRLGEVVVASRTDVGRSRESLAALKMRQQQLGSEIEDARRQAAVAEARLRGFETPQIKREAQDAFLRLEGLQEAGEIAWASEMRLVRLADHAAASRQPYDRFGGKLGQRLVQQLERQERFREEERRVRDFLESGECFEPAASDEAQMARLIDRELCASVPYSNVHQRHVYREQLSQASEQLRELLIRVERIFRADGIPVVMGCVEGKRFELVHMKWRDRLDWDDWRLIVERVLMAASQTNVEVRWGGDQTPRNPTKWELVSEDVVDRNRNDVWARLSERERSRYAVLGKPSPLSRDEINAEIDRIVNAAYGIDEDTT